MLRAFCIGLAQKTLGVFLAVSSLLKIRDKTLCGYQLWRGFSSEDINLDVGWTCNVYFVNTIVDRSTVGSRTERNALVRHACCLR